MKRIALLSLLLFFVHNGYAQEIEFKEYSYSQFFNLIQDGLDSIFILEDAIIKYNETEDSLFVLTKQASKNLHLREDPLLINKEIRLNNVHFLTKYEDYNSILKGVIVNVRFEEKITINTILSAQFYGCTFEEQITSRTGQGIKEALNFNRRLDQLRFNNCVFKKGAIVVHNLMNQNPYYGVDIGFENCDIFLDTLERGEIVHQFLLFSRNLNSVILENNNFIGNGIARYRAIESIFHFVNKNSFKNVFAEFYISDGRSFNTLRLNDNIFGKSVLLDIDIFTRKYDVPINQFDGNLYSENAFTRFQEMLRIKTPNFRINNSNYESTVNLYKTAIIENEEIHNQEIRFKAQLHEFYKSSFNNKAANIIYVETKNLETAGSKFLYKTDPSFKAYFTWKINQFLKVFSAYGTEPARSIVYSLYVIFFFAFIYLFYPNSWDRHGKKRIMDRFRFFTKYLNQDAGIHEVYLEEKKEDLLEYEDFKNYMETNGKTIPKFFTATALPLYKWAISGTRISSAFLKRIDIIKGTWSELPKKRKWWKGLLLIGAFSIAIIYDLFIKVLNALMLSINTFTTLGFGEIPIKGLPRYLAIIEGFIGWFMLTIFSVSLISQLLN